MHFRFVRLTLALVLAAAAGSSFARISYSGRNFGTLIAASKRTADSTKSYALTLGVTAAPVPEPQTWLLMLAGTTLLALRRRNPLHN